MTCQPGSPHAHSDIHCPAVAEPAVADGSPVADGQEAPPSPRQHYPFECTIQRLKGDWKPGTSTEHNCTNFGVCCGNGGDDWGDDQQTYNFMRDDLSESPGHVICLQEATKSLCTDLEEKAYEQPQQQVLTQTAERSRKTAQASPKQHWLVVRGCEESASTAVAVRDTYVRGLRRDCFILHDAGLWKNSRKFNRLMFCTLKFRQDYFQNNIFCAKDEMGIATVHLHYGCASTKKHRRSNGLQEFLR